MSPLDVLFYSTIVLFCAVMPLLAWLLDGERKERAGWPKK